MSSSKYLTLAQTISLLCCGTNTTQSRVKQNTGKLLQLKLKYFFNRLGVKGFITIFIKSSEVWGFTSIHEKFTYLFNLNTRFVQESTMRKENCLLHPVQFTLACLEHCFILSTTDSMHHQCRMWRKWENLGILGRKPGFASFGTRGRKSSPEWDAFSKVLGKLKVRFWVD